MSGVAQKVSYQLRDQINKKMNRLPLSFYDKTTHGETLSLISNDVDTVSTTLNQSLTQMITATHHPAGCPCDGCSPSADG